MRIRLKFKYIRRKLFPDFYFIVVLLRKTTEFFTTL